jgi:hypothetical protein
MLDNVWNYCVHSFRQNDLQFERLESNIKPIIGIKNASYSIYS